MSIYAAINVGLGGSVVKRSPRVRARSKARRGASAVEFAIVAPILFLLILLPMLEFGRALVANELIANSARAGCRVGVLRGTDSSTITSTVNSTLSNGGIAGATTTIKVNGATADASTALQGDQITVTVTVPYNSVAWLPSGSSFFMSGKSLSTTQVMRRE